MIAVDTHILARFYCHDPGDTEAAKQRQIARQVILQSPSLFVPLTVVLELEWVMRGFYELTPAQFCGVVEHLLGMSHVSVERWEAVKDALPPHLAGMDFADVLHWSCSQHCDKFVTFDDRKFARRAKKFGFSPEVTLPQLATH